MGSSWILRTDTPLRRNRRNVFVDCKRPLGSAPWNDKRWTEFLQSKLMDERLRKDVDITSPVYTERYPSLQGYLDNPLKDKRVSLARRNLIVRPTEKITGNWVLDESNVIVDRFDDFVDADKGDYPSSEQARTPYRLRSVSAEPLRYNVFERESC